MILIRIPVALRHLAAISLGVAWLAVNAEATQYTWNMQISSGYGMDSQTTWWNHGTLANGSMAWASTNDMRFNGAGTPGSYAAGQSGWVQALRWGDFSAARNVKDILFVTPPQGASQWQLGQREDISGARNGALTVYGNVKVGETNANTAFFDFSYINSSNSPVQRPVLFSDGTHVLLANGSSSVLGFVDGTTWVGGATNKTFSLTGSGTVWFMTPLDARPVQTNNGTAYARFCSGYQAGYSLSIADTLNLNAGGTLRFSPANKNQAGGGTANTISVGTVNLNASNAKIDLRGYAQTGDYGSWNAKRVPIASTTAASGITQVGQLNVNENAFINQYNATLNIVNGLDVAAGKTLCWKLLNAGATQGSFTKTGAGTLIATNGNYRFTGDITVDGGTYEDRVGVRDGRNVFVNDGAVLNSKGTSQPGGLYTLGSGAIATDTGSCSPYLVASNGTLNANGAGGGVVTVDNGGTVNLYGTWGGGKAGYDCNTWDPAWYWDMTGWSSGLMDAMGWSWGVDDYVAGYSLSGMYDSVEVLAGGTLVAPSGSGAGATVSSALTLRGRVNLRVGIDGDATQADGIAVSEIGTLDYGGTLALNFDMCSSFSAGQSWKLFNGGWVEGTPSTNLSSSVTFYPWNEMHNAGWSDPGHEYTSWQDNQTYYGDAGIAAYWCDYNNVAIGTYTASMVTNNSYMDETYEVFYLEGGAVVPAALAATTVNQFDAVTGTGKFGSLTFVRSGNVWTARAGNLRLRFSEATGTLAVSTEAAGGPFFSYK